MRLPSIHMGGSIKNGSNLMSKSFKISLTVHIIAAIILIIYIITHSGCSGYTGFVRYEAHESYHPSHHFHGKIVTEFITVHIYKDGKVDILNRYHKDLFIQIIEYSLSEEPCVRTFKLTRSNFKTTHYSDLGDYEIRIYRSLKDKNPIQTIYSNGTLV